MQQIAKEKHRAIMINILRDIYSNREIGSYLGFKGGTAAYLFYDLPRFSVDLDFNLLKPSEELATKIFKILGIILRKYGDITDENIKFSTVFYNLCYEKSNRNLKVEISTRTEENKYELLDLYGLKIRVMKKEYMFSRKLIALVNRTKLASRDLFDINYFLLKNWDLVPEILEEFSGKNVDEFLGDAISFITKNFSEKNVLDGVGELLFDIEQKGLKYKRELINSTIFNLKLYQDRYLRIGN